MSTPNHGRAQLEVLSEMVETLNQMRDKLTNLAQDLREFQFEVDAVQREMAQEDCRKLIARASLK